jgi:hypothetical protein
MQNLRENFQRKCTLISFSRGSQFFRSIKTPVIQSSTNLQKNGEQATSIQSQTPNTTISNSSGVEIIDLSNSSTNMKTTTSSHNLDPTPSKSNYSFAGMHHVFLEHQKAGTNDLNFNQLPTFA